MPVSLAAIDEARRRIAGSVLRTPLVRLNGIDAPAEIHLKLENLQPIGSFKMRGAANAIAHIPKDQLGRGVLTASAGNMAQGVAFCARRMGVPATVVMPDTAPKTKIEAVERLGCECAISANRLKMVLADGVEIRDIYRLAAERDVRIRRLNFRRDTLEDIFLRAMET